MVEFVSACLSHSGTECRGGGTHTDMLTQRKGDFSLWELKPQPHGLASLKLLGRLEGLGARSPQERPMRPRVSVTSRFSGQNSESPASAWKSKPLLSSPQRSAAFTHPPHQPAS